MFLFKLAFLFLLPISVIGNDSIINGLKFLEGSNESKLRITCGTYKVYGDGKSCSKTKHCGDNGNSFCFDGVEVIDEGKQSNLNMMYYFCTDLEFPKKTPPLGIGFGPCGFDNKLPIEEREIRVEGKLVCMCQDKQWQCFSK